MPSCSVFSNSVKEKQADSRTRIDGMQAPCGNIKRDNHRLVFVAEDPQLVAEEQELLSRTQVSQVVNMGPDSGVV